MGSCDPLSNSFRTVGRCTNRPMGRISSCGTANLNSNVRTSANSSAFSLKGVSYGTSAQMRSSREEKAYTHSVTENLYPMHACGPPRNVRRCPQTPGTLEIASGGLSHLSGLGVLGHCNVSRCRVWTHNEGVLELECVVPPYCLRAVYHSNRDDDAVSFRHSAKIRELSVADDARSTRTVLHATPVLCGPPGARSAGSHRPPSQPASS